MTSPRSHAALKRQYNHLNRKYFDSQLPADITIIWTALDTAHGKTWVPEKTIHMDIALVSQQRLRAIILLHEMCHLAEPRANHGRKFKSCIQRLFDKGAYHNLL